MGGPLRVMRQTGTLRWLGAKKIPYRKVLMELEMLIAVQPCRAHWAVHWSPTVPDWGISPTRI